MDVTATSAETGQPAAQRSAQENAALDYDAFLRLLIAQLENQDPTDPADPTEQLSQLAQFSQVEQSIQTNAKLDSLLAALSLGQADGVIGRTVTSADGAVTGEVASLRILSNGTVAQLVDGQEVTLGPGVTIA